MNLIHLLYGTHCAVKWLAWFQFRMYELIEHLLNPLEIRMLYKQHLADYYHNISTAYVRFIGGCLPG